MYIKRTFRQMHMSIHQMYACYKCMKNVHFVHIFHVLCMNKCMLLSRFLYAQANVNPTRGGGGQVDPINCEGEQVLFVRIPPTISFLCQNPTQNIYIFLLFVMSELLLS